MPTSDNVKGPGKRRGRVKWRTCYIEASGQTNLGILENVLSSKGIRVLNTSTTALIGSSPSDTLKHLILEADLVIAVLDEKASNFNAAYVVGFARGIGKEVLVIVPPEIKVPPGYLTELLYVRASLSDREPIDFVLTQAQQAPSTSKRWVREAARRSRPIGQVADELIAQLDNLGKADLQKGMRVEQIVARALEESGVSIVTSPQESGDIAVWADELSLLGNPLLIEVKWDLGNIGPTHPFANIDRYLRASSKWSLVLYVEGQPTPPVWLKEWFPNVLFMQVRAFLDDLRVRSFAQVVSDLRNRQVHGLTP